MKKLICLFLILVLLPIVPASATRDTILYTATCKKSDTIYADMSKSAKAIGRVREGSSVNVYAVYPEWVYINSNGNTGYVQRASLYAGKAIDKESTPPWGVEFYQYVGTVGKNGAAIRSAPQQDAEVLVQLNAGTRISIIEMQDGWARLSYYRQYGYIDSTALAELLPVCANAAYGTDDLPIATFTSFYVVGSEDVSVHGKEVNIGVNCSYMNGETLASGKTLNYDEHYGKYTSAKGYVKGPVLVETGWGLGMGGGVCQVSSTLYNLLLQLPGISIIHRQSHGPSGIAYLPLDMDAAVGNPDRGINMIFRNDYDFALRFEALAQSDGALFIAIYRVTEE